MKYQPDSDLKTIAVLSPEKNGIDGMVITIKQSSNNSIRIWTSKSDDIYQINTYELPRPIFEVDRNTAPSWLTTMMDLKINAWVVTNFKLLDELELNGWNGSSDIVTKFKNIKDPPDYSMIDDIYFHDVMVYGPKTHGIPDMQIGFGKMSNEPTLKLCVSTIKGKWCPYDDPMMLAYPDFKIDRSKATEWMTDDILDKLDSWIRLNYPLLEKYQLDQDTYDYDLLDIDNALVSLEHAS